MNRDLTPEEFDDALAACSHTMGSVEDEGRRIRLNLSDGRVILITARDRTRPFTVSPLRIEEVEGSVRRVAVKTVNHLEVLHRVCERKGWKMLLLSEDVAERGESRLCILDVVDRENERVAWWPLNDATTPQDAAAALLDGLQKGGLVP